MCSGGGQVLKDKITNVENNLKNIVLMHNNVEKMLCNYAVFDKNSVKVETKSKNACNCIVDEL